jgi:hypothetical protein
VPEATHGRGRLVTRTVPMRRWLRTGLILSIVLEQRDCRCQTEMRRGMVLACTYALRFCRGLGELSCAVSPKVAVLLCWVEGRRLHLLVTVREERLWAALSLVARRHARSPSRAGLLVIGAAEDLRCLWLKRLPCPQQHPFGEHLLLPAVSARDCPGGETGWSRTAVRSTVLLRPCSLLAPRTPGGVGQSAAQLWAGVVPLFLVVLDFLCLRDEKPLGRVGSVLFVGMVQVETAGYCVLRRVACRAEQASQQQLLQQQLLLQHEW